MVEANGNGASCQDTLFFGGDAGPHHCIYKWQRKDCWHVDRVETPCTRVTCVALDITDIYGRENASDVFAMAKGRYGVLYALGARFGDGRRSLSLQAPAMVRAGKPSSTPLTIFSRRLAYSLTSEALASDFSLA
jgi:hypothetical protein